MDREEAARHARTAILVTCALYGAYALISLVVPGGQLAFLLVLGFYFVPTLVLRDQPELAESWQVGPDVPIPPWSWRGARVFGIAAAIVFPIFVMGFLWFYWRTCQGDLRVLSPVLWAESLTPAAGDLEAFMSRLCRAHGGGLFPEGLRVPRSWTEYYGLAVVYWVAVELFAIALPEEVFHRGYLMNALEERWPPERRVFGVRFGLAAVLSSALFALGHLVGEARTDRLFTFFPSLLFAWLFRKSESLWAPALFHAAANLLMQVLLASTFPGR